MLWWSVFTDGVTMLGIALILASKDDEDVYFRSFCLVFIAMFAIALYADLRALGVLP